MDGRGVKICEHASTKQARALCGWSYGMRCMAACHQSHAVDRMRRSGKASISCPGPRAAPCRFAANGVGNEEPPFGSARRPPSQAPLDYV